MWLFPVCENELQVEFYVLVAAACLIAMFSSSFKGWDGSEGSEGGKQLLSRKGKGYQFVAKNVSKRRKLYFLRTGTSFS